MNRFYPLHVVTVRPRTELGALADELAELCAHIPRDRSLVLPPGASFTVVVPEPGGLRTFRARTSLGLVPAPIGCAP